MKKFMSDKMWLILQVCSLADGPLNADELSAKLIEVCHKNKQYGFWGKIISHLGEPVINAWLAVVYHRGFLTDCLEELIFAGRILAVTDNRQSRYPDFRYSITARGRRSFRIFVRYHVRSKMRKQKTSLA
jgi:hypothetical protein